MNADEIMEIVRFEVRRIRRKSLRVFISSTFKDLERERLAVKKALNLCECVPVLAEDAQRQPGKNLLDQIRFWLKDIDLLILLVSERYGEIGNSQKSWTETEVEEAIGTRKLIFSYFVKTKVPAGIEWNEEQRDRLEKFKSRLNALQDQQPPQYTKGTQELVMRIVRDVTALQCDYRIDALQDGICSQVRDKEIQEMKDSYDEGFLG